MNKLLIVLLAVCIVSAHAFVKRDAPTAADDVKAAIQAVHTKIIELGTTFSEQVSKTYDPDVIKQQFQEFVDAAKKTVDSLTPAATTEPKPAA